MEGKVCSRACIRGSAGSSLGCASGVAEGAAGSGVGWLSPPAEGASVGIAVVSGCWGATPPQAARERASARTRIMHKTDLLFIFIPPERRRKRIGTRPAA